MGSITDFLEDELLDHVFNAAYSPAAHLYLVLCTADPTDAATGASCNETADSDGYARTLIVFALPQSRRTTQISEIEFPQASGDYGSPITHWAIADSETHGAGNVLAHGSFADSKSISSGDTPTVGASEIYVEFTASEISDYLAEELLDHAFRNQSYGEPSTYVALCSEVVADADTGSTISEPSGGSYARVAVHVNGDPSPTWDVSSSGVVDNTHAIDFATASADWGTIVAVAIVDASSAGNLLFYANDMVDKDVGNGDTAQFAVGELDIQMT